MEMLHAETQNLSSVIVECISSVKSTGSSSGSQGACNTQKSYAKEYPDEDGCKP